MHGDRRSAKSDAQCKGWRPWSLPWVPMLGRSPCVESFLDSLQGGVAKTRIVPKLFFLFFFWICLGPPRGRGWAKNVPPGTSFRTPKYRPNPASGDPIGGKNAVWKTQCFCNLPVGFQILGFVSEKCYPPITTVGSKNTWLLRFVQRFSDFVFGRFRPLFGLSRGRRAAHT